jgi:DNA polymerase III subunit gamma/tau
LQSFVFVVTCYTIIGMENFIVSARKYRPATFDTVVGQGHVTTTLKNAIQNNHLAQAFLFCGPRGVGKTTCARILAKTINCQNLTTEGEACDKCDSCVAFNRNASYNISELDAASNNSVDDIRNLIEQVRVPPQMGKRKVYIIDEVHMLSTAAFNAFLKTLEEPPSYAIFILATTEKHKILPTILSRCQIFDFNRIKIADMANHLASIAKKENIEAEEDALRLIAQKADGGLRDALSMFDLIVTFSGKTVSYKKTIENLHILDYDYYFRMTDAFLSENLSQALLIFDEILRNGFDGHNFTVGLCEHFRNLLVCKDLATVILLEVSENVQKKYAEQGQKSSVSFLLSAVNIANQTDLGYKSSKQPKLHVEIMLMKLTHLNRALDLPSMIEDLKKKSELNRQQLAQQTPKPLAHNPATNPITQENGGLKTTPKINAALEPQPSNAKPEEENKQNIVKEPTIKLNKPINEQELEKEWQIFADKLKIEGKVRAYTSLTSYPIKLKGTDIELPLANPSIEESGIKEIRESLILHLRQTLQNSNIMFSTVKAVITEEMPKKVFTNQDKFRRLIEKFPILTELKNSLGLDYDF